MDALAKLPAYDEYKKTRVKWLEEVPSHWSEFPICSKAKLKSITNKAGEDLLSVYLDKGVIRYDEVEQKRTNVTSLDLSKYQLVEVGDFVLNNQQAWRGSVGVSSYRGIVSPAYLVLSVAQDLLSNFANYLFRDGGMVSHYLVSSKGVGTIQRNLYWPHLKRAPLFIPPVEEQISIANFLDQKTAQIDEAIAIKEKQIALLKERKQIIIQKAVTQGLDPNVPMKDSGVEWIGQIPEHWEVKKLKYLAKIFRGKFTHRPRNDPSLYDGEYPFFQTGDVARASKYLKNYRQTLNQKGLRVSTLIPKGTIVITIAANIGDVAILDLDACFPDSVVGFSPTSELGRDFLYFALGNMKQQFMDSSIKNTQMNLNVERIGSNFICVPSLEEQEMIVKHIEKVELATGEGVALQLTQIEKLKEYKTTLINSAVTGKIKVA